MKKIILTLSFAFASLIGSSQIVYKSSTFNAVRLDTAWTDSIQVHMTINVQVYSTIVTRDCIFKVAKVNTWNQIEAIIEDKCEHCYQVEF